ncbi:hypothetical protein Slin15195_G039990 [Septoria linicola]|uniref:Uncharacterized protein n=1 Tax=Septoria linicola TaxID=215465 RepID=A0A9Q9AQF3_9PEZI|nr:hypothetical protein Slin15195_G039990 [Septoria linicola]
MALSMPSETDVLSVDHDDCHKALLHLFRVIQQQVVGLRLTLFNQNSVVERRYSKLDHYREKWHASFLPPSLDDLTSLELIAEAVQASNVRIHELVVRTGRGVPSQSLTEKSSCYLLREILEHVQRLEMCIDVDQSSPKRSGNFKQSAETFFRTVSNAPHLRSLVVAFREESDGGVPLSSQYLLENQYPLLQHLLLKSTWLPMGDLQAFVQRHPQLCTLGLRNVDFMRGSFSDDLLGDFDVQDESDIHGPVRQLIGLPGEYHRLWSDDIALRAD